MIPPFQVEEWSSRMTELFEDASRAREMGEAALEEFLAKYQLPLVATRLEDLYRSIATFGER